MNLLEMSRDSKELMFKKSPEIFMGIGTILGIATVGSGIYATTKAVRKADDIRERELDRKEEKKAIAKEILPLYIPTALFGFGSLASFYGAYNVEHRRFSEAAGVISAYGLYADRMRHFRDEVKEELGERKEAILEAKATQDVAEESGNDIPDESVRRDGQMLMWDWCSGRYFWCSPEELDRIENRLNHRLLTEMYLNLNEFYDEIDIPHIALGEELGWNVDWGLIEFTKEFGRTEDGQECCYIRSILAPKCLYRDRYY